MATRPSPRFFAYCFGLTALLLGLVSSGVAQDTTGITGSNAPIDNRQPTLAVRYMISTYGIFPDDPQGTPTQTQPPNRTDPFMGEIKPVPFDSVLPTGWMYCEGQSLAINRNQALFALIGTTYGGNGVTTFNLPDLRGRVPIGAGEAPGLPNYALGDVVGAAQVTLAVANLPAHAHTFAGATTGMTGDGVPIENRQPSLALQFLIAANGEIALVPWPQQPTGWTRCDGRLLSVSAHPYLFQHIGYTYGGDNSSVFALPDLRGRVVIGDDNGATWPRGLAYGTTATALSVADMAAHAHTIPNGTTDLTGGTGASANNYQPSLVLRWLISFSGTYPNNGSGVSFPMVGEMRLIAGNSAAGLTSGQWQRCDGGLYNIDDNFALYNLIGTTYGGDGASTFAVPDLRSRASASVNAPALPIGAAVGTEKMLISVAQLAAHTHALSYVRITGLRRLSDGSVELSLAGTVGATCQVEKSDGLSNWTPLATIQLTQPTATVSDPDAAQVSHRYYRARQP